MIWPRLMGRILPFLLCAGAAAPVCAAKPKIVHDQAAPLEIVDGRGSQLVQHAGRYETPTIEWQLEPRVPAAAAIFADPYVPAHVLVATGSGLVETRDHGQSWQAIAAASTGRIGPISSICFRLDACDRYYVGSKTRGLWQTIDGGKTFKPLASKATGLAADSVLAVYLYPEDKLGRTLLVIHGEDAPGLSRSVNNGKTWQVLYPDYHVLRIVFHRNSSQVMLVAATREHPEIHNVYYLPSLQEPWQTLITTPFARARRAAPAPRRRLSFHFGQGHFQNLPRRRRRQERRSFERPGVGVARFDLRRRRRDRSVLRLRPQEARAGALYGRAVGSDSRGTWQRVGEGQPARPPPRSPYSVQSHGLFTGPLVAEGAHIQANANGTVFYAVANKSLYVGRQNVPARSWSAKCPSIRPSRNSSPRS